MPGLPDHFGEAVHAPTHHRDPAGHGFERWEPESFGQRGEYEDGGLPIECREALVRHIPHETNDPAHVEPRIQEAALRVEFLL